MSLSVNQNQNNKYPYNLNSKVISDLQKYPADIVSSNNIVVNAYDYKDDPRTIMTATIPVWAALSSGMQVFNKHCATIKKDGKKTSILHKVQDLSDKVGQKFDSSKFGKVSNTVFSKISNFFKTKLINKNQVLSSIVNTPAEPQLSMAKMVSKGTIAETAQDAVEAIQRYCINTGKTIEELGLIKNADFDIICKDPYKYLPKIKKILRRIPEQPIEVCRSSNPITKKILSRKVYPSELINKINILSGQSLRHKKLSSIGKFVPKAFIRTMEGLTNGTAGGKLAILMQAYSIGDAIVRTIQAPKGEKVSTFTEALTYDLSYYLMMPVGMGIMYHAGGSKYTGMTPQQVSKYRRGVKALNDKVASGNCTKEQYKRVKGLLKQQLKGDTSLSLKNDGVLKTAKKAITNIINTPFKTIGKLMTTGLEQIAPYTNSSTPKSLKFIKNIPNKFKGLFGGGMRFGLYMFLIAPPLAKAVTKISHLVFGKPTYSILDEKTVNVEPNQVAGTVKVQTPNRQFEKYIYSDKTNYIDMYKEAKRLEQERQELLKPSLKTQELLQTKSNSESQKITNEKQNEDKNIIPKKVLYEESQNGYVPSTKGYVEEAEEIGYIPSTKAAKDYPEDLTAAKIAIQNSLLAENLTNKRMKDRFRHRI